MTTDGFAPHFPYPELIESHTARRHGIDNTPPNSLLPSLMRLSWDLEQIREAIGNVPIAVTSGYRCPELETMVGGTMTRELLEDVRDSTSIAAVRVMAEHRIAAGQFRPWGSSHSMGLAADIVAPQFGTPLALCRRIEVLGIPFDQIIHEYGGWCHLGIGPGTRRQLLTYDHAGPPRTGLHESRIA